MGFKLRTFCVVLLDMDLVIESFSYFQNMLHILGGRRCTTKGADSAHIARQFKKMESRSEV